MAATTEHQMKLLATIFTNILRDPGNRKFRDLNFKQISKRLNHSSTYLQWLYNAGFLKSKDCKRLTLHPSKLHQLVDICECLKMVIGHPSLSGAKYSHNLCIQTILKNILNDPKNEKFRKLNLKRVISKLNHSLNHLTWLFQAGFEKSNDGKYLVFNSNCFDKLSDTYQTLTMSLVINAANVSARHISSHAESKHLLNSSYFAENIVNNCNLNNCVSLINIGCVLTGYVEKVSLQEIYKKIDDQYDRVGLLNDYNHLLLQHSNQFEDVYDRLRNIVYNTFSCDLSKCLSMMRNRRDRSEIITNDKILNKIYFESDTIVEQQLFDRIHCHFFHTFDMGYRIKQKDKQTILHNYNEQNHNYIVEKINALIKSKKQQNYTHLKSNKFMTAPTLQQYQYGVRFYYWKYYKKYGGQVDPVRKDFDMKKTRKTWNESMFQNEVSLSKWYINKNYNTFKEELIQNEIYHISQTQWGHNYSKAMAHLLTKKVREIYCPRRESAKCYEMKYEQNMSVDHIIALMIYCNYDQLQSQFTKTFWKQNQKMTDFQFKKRHRQYYFLARSLRECVECFGLNFKFSCSEGGWPEIMIYHGVNQHFVFPSVFPSINSPFSTTTDYTVAARFAENSGMILELKIITGHWFMKICEASNEGRERLCCFDCQWISDFSNESEILFIGGLNRIIMQNIIEVSTAKSHKMYVDGLMGIMTLTVERRYRGPIYGSSSARSMFQNGDVTYMQAQMIFKLLSHRLFTCKPQHKLAIEFKTCPRYIKTLLHSQCIHIPNVSLMRITPSDKYDGGFYQNLSDSFFFNLDKEHHGWIDFDLVMTVFPNCRVIQCIATSQQEIHKDVFETLLSFIQQNQRTWLKHVAVWYPNILEKQVYEMTSKGKYDSLFHNLSWKVSVVVMQDSCFPKFGTKESKQHIVNSARKHMLLNFERV
eukprot:540834_1